jgi:ABC-2 type transport system permease protein
VKKYLHVFTIGLQNTMAYRFNFFTRILFGFIPLMGTILLWKTIYAGKAEGSSISGYTLQGMISYYLVITIVDAFTAVSEDDWQIAADIKDGNISQFLLKPLNYLTYRFTLFLSGRAVYTLVALVPVGIFLICYRSSFYIPVHGSTFGWFAISICLTAAMQFFLSYAMALLAFWVAEVSTFIFILYAFEYLAGGHVFPLSLLPPAIVQVLNFTPFPFQLFFPVSIYLEQISGAELGRGLAIQALWVFVLYGVARWTWSRGIRKYSAVGG